MFRYHDSMSPWFAPKYSSAFGVGETNSVCGGDGTAGTGVAGSGLSTVADGGGVLPTRFASSYYSVSNPIVWNSKPRFMLD
jgi:hypothetical protein